jgi:hypothetical protein
MKQAQQTNLIQSPAESYKTGGILESELWSRLDNVRLPPSSE